MLTLDALGQHLGSPLAVVVQWFKTMTTNAYMPGVKQRGWRSFEQRLWQRNYYEHIVRNDESLNRIRQYIAENPACWSEDHENPTRTTLKPRKIIVFYLKPSLLCHLEQLRGPSRLHGDSALGLRRRHGKISSLLINWSLYVF